MEIKGLSFEGGALSASSFKIDSNKSKRKFKRKAEGYTRKKDGKYIKYTSDTIYKTLKIDIEPNLSYGGSRRGSRIERTQRFRNQNSNPETFINKVKVWGYANEVEKQNKYAQKMALPLDERKAIKKAKREERNAKYREKKTIEEIAKMKREVDLHIIRLQNNLR